MSRQIYKKMHDKCEKVYTFTKEVHSDIIDKLKNFS